MYVISNGLDHFKHKSANFMSKRLDPVRLPDGRPRMLIWMRLNMPMLHDPESDPRQLFQLYVDPELDPDKDPVSRVRIRI